MSLHCMLCMSLEHRGFEDIRDNVFARGRRTNQQSELIET